MTKPSIAKVVLVGTTGVGKTSILLRHNAQGFTTQISPTIGASFCKTEMIVGNKCIQLQIWDTAGQERFRAMAPMYYRNTNAAFVVYDVTSKESFYALRSWVAELNQKTEQPVVICILGNKIDLEAKREVSAKAGEEYAQSVGAMFFETSALSNKGIEDAFRAIATQLIQQQLITDSTGSQMSRSDSEDRSDSKFFRCC